MRPVFVALLLAALPTPVLAGYTHSWTWKKSPDRARVRKCIEDMKRVIAASPVRLGGPDGTGKPSLTDDLIAFNLAGDDQKIGEPFVFPGVSTMRNSCKTNGLAYDAVVTACLLVVMDHFTKEDVDISSDGKIAEGAWDEGIALYKKVLQREPNFSKGNGGLGDLVHNINLKPSWGVDRLFIMLGLLAAAGLVLWVFLNPRPHFVILAGSSRELTFRGKFPDVYAGAIREFFQKDVPGPQSVTVKGWHEPGGRFRLTFAGDISDKDQQRVRNFFGMLRKR